uniref:Defensin-like protein n=1 Tax=Panagrolaimus sp. PS1159 TaxID=55785 RepID=A0AC35G918_9BILA
MALYSSSIVKILLLAFIIAFSFQLISAECIVGVPGGGCTDEFCANSCTLGDLRCPGATSGSCDAADSCRCF